MYSSKLSRLIAMLIIDVIFLALELAVGIALGSLALMADAFHMLNDIISLSAGIWAVLVAQRSSTDKYSFGYLRAEILGAFFNAVFLIALCMSIILEATQRLLDPPQISNPKLILIIGIFGLISNLGGLFILGGHGHSHGVPPKSELPDLDNHSHDQNLKDNGSETVNYNTQLESNSSLSPLNDASIEPNKILSKSIPKKKSRDESLDSLHQGDSTNHQQSPRPSIVAKSGPKSDGKFCDNFKRNVEDQNYETDESYQAECEPLIKKKEIPNKSRIFSLIKKDSHISQHQGHNHKRVKTPKHEHHDHSDMGMDAMILHVIGDALGNIGVIISGLVIWLTKWPERFYADPVVSLFITLIILRSAIPLTIESAKILLQATPDHIEVDMIKNDVEALPGITNCHHIHIWQLSGTQLVASMHIHFDFSMSDASGEKYMDAARAVRKCLHAHGIHSVTIQPEFSHHNNSSSNLNLHVSSNLDSSLGQSRYGLDIDKCLLECVDNCQGKPCCNPKAT